ncbi:MAG TPA: hypothetical protein PKM73_12805 [Verrucomicrobiota bacterium]|nr:hypothetical protein [Verrucomicrobiota bacterium]HNU51607.1 hypothetical protein [Verrucomicrobiota bacterium]
MGTKREPSGERPAPGRAPGSAEWIRVLRAGVQAQRLVPGAVCVGGTAAALYAGHRLSHDTDHVVATLRDQFDEVRAQLESRPEWRTARVNPPVLILGSIGDVDVGFRQLKRTRQVETQVADTEAGPLLVPTWDEMVCMKAFLAYDRNATRDYLDFAALSECASEAATLESLLKLDARYAGLQTVSVALEVAKALSAAAPFDLDESELPHYRGLGARWHRWETTRDICRRFGVLLGESLVRGGA